MKREQEKTDNVESRHIVILESVYHHRIDVVMPERISLEQVIRTIGLYNQKPAD